jgi:hypothetical protein
MRKLALILLPGLVLAPSAAAFIGPEQRDGDLDGDPGTESVQAVRVDIRGVANRFDQTKVRVIDNCDGQEITADISSVQDNLATLRLKRVDRRRGREVFFDMRSGAAGRLGEARIVAWRPSGGTPCRVPRDLFRYQSDRHTRTPRGGTGDISAFDVDVRDFTKRYRGLEVRLVENFLRRGEPSCCGSLEKTTFWRYSTARDRFVRYGRARVKRLRFRR